MKKSVLLGTLLFGSAAFSLPLVSVEASIGYMSQDPSGNLSYKGDTLNLKEDLGLSKENKPFARVKLELPVVPNLYLQYIPMRFEGNKDKSITYGNTTFTGNLQTTVKLDHYDIGLYYNIPIGWVTSLGTLGTLSVDPEIGINVRVLNFEGSVTGRVGPVTRTVSKKISVPVPMGYVGLGINAPFVSLMGELRYIAYSGSRYYDVTGEVRVKPVPLVFVGVGYRQENLKLDNVSDVYSDIKIKSLFANVGVSF